MKTKGWQKIFSFTFVQYVKTKTFIVGTIIICILTAAICVLTNIFPNLMNPNEDLGGIFGGEVSEGENFFTDGKLYLFDEAKILSEDDKKQLSNIFKERFSEPAQSINDITDEMSASNGMETAVRIIPQNDKDGRITGYEVRSYYSAGAKSSVDMIGGTVCELVNRRILLNAGVAPEKYEDTRVSVFTSKTQAGGQNLNSMQSIVNYALPLLITLVLFLLIYTYGSIVAQSIATEKTSRVMELLLTSVRPLAVVIGKVLAMGLVSFLQFAIIIVVGMASFAVSSPFGWIGKATELLRDPEMQEALSQMAQGAAGASNVSTAELEMAQTISGLKNMLTPLNIVAVIVIFILGFLVFSLIAALIGASISRMEDLQTAMTPYSMIGVVGMYLAYFPVVFNAENLESGDAAANPVQIFSCFFPISSPFALPSAVLLGTLEPWKIAVSIGVLCAFVVLIAIVVGKVYEAIILHNGNRIKLADIIKMAARR